MWPTNPQKDLKSRKGNERFSRTSLEMKFLGSIDARDGSSELTPCASRLTIYDKEFTLCSMRSALCCLKMAQDRLEECLQAVVAGENARTVER